MECANDIEELRKRTTEDKIYILIAGLNHNLDQVSGRILAASLFPRLEETIHKFVMKIRVNSPWELKIDQKRRPLLSKRTTLNQHLLFALPTLFLLSTLIITTQDTPKKFVGGSMAIWSGTNLSKE